MYFVRNDQTYFTKILVKTLLFSIKKIFKKNNKKQKTLENLPMFLY